MRVFLFLSVLITLVLPRLATAADCGRSLKAHDIAEISDRVLEAQKNIGQHTKSLTAELRATGGPEISQELDLTRWIIQYAEGLRQTLLLTRTLASLRDEMRDPRDKATVQKYLAGVASNSRAVFSSARDGIGANMTSLKRPSIAVDASRLRDLSADSAKLFAECDTRAQ